MNAKFASCALVMLALVLSFVDGQQWRIPYTDSRSMGLYPPTTGTSGSTYHPGPRFGSAEWQDTTGNIWIFGGTGYGADNTAGAGELNDLWSWNGTTWTWWGGATTINTAATGFPSARVYPAAWTDGTNLYLYGGSTQATNSYFADMWEYAPSTNKWTSLPSNVTNYVGNFPTSTTAGTGSPPALTGTTTWVANGLFWMFGGYRSNGNSPTGDYNDLWAYNPGTSVWTWYNGGKAGQTSTTTGTTQPGPRSGGLDFYISGQLYLFGGFFDPNSAAYNDMWKYQISSSTWTYVAGSQTLNNNPTPPSVGGTGIPKARGYAGSWTDTKGNFWFFGGLTQSSAFTDDFWMFSPTNNVFTLMGGSTSANQVDKYGATAFPGSRSSVVTWVDSIGQLQLFGGNGFGATSGPIYQIAIYNGSPLLTTSSVSTSTTSSATLAASSSSSATTSATSVATTSSASTGAASNLATTSTSSSNALSTSSSVSSTSTTVGVTTSSSASVAGVVSGNAATSSTTVAATTSTLSASSSTSAVASTTNTASNSVTSTLATSTLSTSATQASSSSTSLSTQLTAGGAQATSTQATTSSTASTASTVSTSSSASTVHVSSSASSTSATATGLLTVTASTSASADLATSTSTSVTSATSLSSQISATQSSSTSAIVSTTSSNSVSTTSKATTIAQAVSSSSSASTTANTHATTAITITSTVATSVTSVTSTSSTRATSSSSSSLTTSTSTTAVAGAHALTPLFALVATIAFGALLL